MELNTAQIFEKILAIPDEHRFFRETADTARRQYGIQPALLQSLLNQGLPSAKKEGDLYFDPFDLSNLSLHLRLPSVQRMAMRSWGRTLELAACATSHEVTISLDSVYPAEQPVDASRAMLRLELPQRDHRKLEDLTERRDVLDTVARQSFFMLPEAFRWNTAFLLEHRICECGGASKLLVEEASRAGMKARHCFGILIAAPYSTGHFWAEIETPSGWTAFDPLLIKLLHQTTRMDRGKWPLHRSPGAAFHRLLTIEAYGPDGSPVLNGYSDVPYLSNLMVITGNLITPLSLSTTIVAASAST